MLKQKKKKKGGSGGKTRNKVRWPHHKSGTAETGVAIARFILNAYPLVAGLWKALINVILTVKACPTCQEQKPTECRGEPRLSHFHPLK